MKKYVTWEDLNALTESQKGALRNMWQPEKHEIVMVPMCQDVEDEVYDFDIYAIQEIVVNPINEDKRYGISRYPVKDYEYHEMTFHAVPLCQSTGENELTVNYETQEMDEGAEIEAIPLCLLNKESCLPLLDISRMLELLGCTKADADFTLQVKGDFCLCTIGGDEYEGESLCDVLWEALQRIL